MDRNTTYLQKIVQDIDKKKALMITLRSFTICFVFGFSMICENIVFAQNISSNWKSVVDSVNTYYKNANFEKKIAVEYLLNNIPYHTSKYDQKLSSYYNKLKFINKTYTYPMCCQHYEELYNTLPQMEPSYISDMNVITAKYIIDNIEKAFVTWKKSDYCKHLSLQDFCEYILPYKIGNENLESWRDQLHEEYASKIDWMKKEDDKKFSSYWAALYINDQIKKLGFHINSIYHYGSVDLPVSVLRNLRMGECTDYAELTAYIMRACGIPVGVDFTPQWPYRSSGHYWNTLLDNTGKNIPFMGGESNPGYPCKAGNIIAKVYRKTFAVQPNSLPNIIGESSEPIPSIFNTHFIKDVSSEYLKGETLTINYDTLCWPNLKRKVMYLSLFNNKEWIPIAYSKIIDNQVSFDNLGRGVVYLPTLWSLRGSLQADYPIEILKNGEKKFLIPDTTKVIKLIMSRKYPKFGSSLYYSQRIVGGYFECANTPDFKKAIKCATITRNPEMHYDSLTINSNGKYRFWRYVSPKKGHCNIAEIKFKEKNRTISPITLFNDNLAEVGYETKYAFDNDELTFYEGKNADENWIAVDMGKPVKVDRIVYLPRNDDNNVVPGHFYRLDYYDKCKYVSLGTKIATGYSIEFDNVPSNALYILHDLSKGREERIFTIENNDIIWH